MLRPASKAVIARTVPDPRWILQSRHRYHLARPFAFAFAFAFACQSYCETRSRPLLSVALHLEPVSHGAPSTCLSAMTAL